MFSGSTWALPFSEWLLVVVPMGRLHKLGLSMQPLALAKGLGVRLPLVHCSRCLRLGEQAFLVLEMKDCSDPFMAI